MLRFAVRRAFSLMQREGWRREFNLPKIIAAEKFQGQPHILVAARDFPIDYPRPHAPASFRIQDIHFVSNFEAVMTSEATAMLAQEDCFCWIIIDITTGRLPPQHESYTSCNPSTSPAIRCRRHLDLNSRSARIPQFPATGFFRLQPTDTLGAEAATTKGERNSRFLNV